MIRTIREDWWRFKASKPGHRFRDRYRHHRRSSQSRFYFRKVLFIVGGLAIAIGSIVLAPLPAPGLGTLLLGLVILATELRLVAGSLDRAEVKLRRPLRRAKVPWASLPPRSRIFIGAVASIGSVAFGLWALLYSSWWAL
jgi:Putative transmembrane protein (PGPGW)